jgi:hypothetical protein
MSILENYKVRFYISDLVGAAIKTNNELLSSFIWEHCDSDRAGDLLDAINDVLNENISIADGATPLPRRILSRGSTKYLSAYWQK